MGQTLNVGIVGCGIGGLAAASLVRDQGHRVTVLDEFDTPRPVGSGLVIQPPGQKVLRQLGILGKALSYGEKIVELEGFDAAGERRVLDARYDAANSDNFGLAIHRGALFDLLLQAAKLRDVEIRSNALVLGKLHVDGVYLRIEGRRQAGPFDLVIDASGVRSALTPLVPKVLPFGALWTVVNLPKGADLGGILRQRYRKARQMAGVLPIGTLPGDPSPKAAIFWSMRSDEFAQFREDDIEDWKARAVALWPDLEYFVRGITDHEDLVFANYGHGSLWKAHAKNIAFIGDAAHQTSPQLGQGANHALLDAAVLAHAMETKSSVPAALRSYSLRRLLHVKSYQLLSRIATPMYQSSFGGMALVRDHVMAPIMSRPGIAGIISRIICGELVRPLPRGQHVRPLEDEGLPLHGPGE